MKYSLGAAICGLSLALGAMPAAAEATLTEAQVRQIAQEVAKEVARQVAEQVARTTAEAVARDVIAKSAAKAATADPEKPRFSDAILADPARIAAGREIWEGQCALCHGKASYPGKAPKLKPKRYTADFVYSRITNGFRKMPSWKEVYDEEERVDIVAWVLSRHFSP